MAIRFLLVSLVAGLGFEPPSATDVQDWAKSGRAWVLARIDDFKGAAIIADRARTDAEFETVVTDMKDGFTADLAATERSKTKPLLAFEPIGLIKTLKTGLTNDYDRLSQGVRRIVIASNALRPTSELVGPPLIELVGPPFIELAGPPAELAQAMPTPVPTEIEPGRISRLASAVRLTRQAASAWMTLLHDTDTTVVRR